MRVRVFYTGSSTNPDQYVNVDPGSTVRAALVAAKVPTDSVSVRVNRQDASIDDILSPEDQVVVTAKNLKGAADEVVPMDIDAINMSVEEIIGWGTGEGKVRTGVVGKALQQQAEEAQGKMLKVVKGLIEEARPQSAYANKQIATLEKALAEAKDHKARFSYALSQLVTKDNPFALLALMGRKHEATALCQAIGCDVPDAKSPLWKTSAED
jgi:hypothetical protein